MNTELIALISGAVALSALHALIPNHWIPFVVVGRNEGWQARTTLFATFIGGTAHLSSTVILGIVVGMVGIAFVKTLERQYTIIAGSILVLLGAVMIFRHFRRKTSHVHLFRHVNFHKTTLSHTDNHSNLIEGIEGTELSQGHSEAMTLSSKRGIVTIGALFIMMFFSPCLELEAYYLIAVRMGWFGVFLVSLIYYMGTVGLMLLFVYALLRGLQKLQMGFLENYEALIGGTLLVIMGLAWPFIPH